MSTAPNFIFSRNDAGSVTVSFLDNGSPLDLESNGVKFALGTYNVDMSVDDAANGIASLQIEQTTLSGFEPGLYDARITIFGNTPTLIPTYINSDQSTGDGGTYNNSAIIDVTADSQAISNSGGSGGVPGPQGPAGEAATITVGTVTDLPAGSTPTVVNSGTSAAAIFDFGLVRGADGSDGDDGDDGVGVPSGGAVNTFLMKSSAANFATAWTSITKSVISDFSDSDYATAAQGTAADNAVQPGANISVLTNNTGFITDAPSDSNQYARINGAWAQVQGGTGDVEEAPNDGNKYFRQNEGWSQYIAPAISVTSVNGATGAVTLGITDLQNVSSSFSSGDLLKFNGITWVGEASSSFASNGSGLNQFSDVDYGSFPGEDYVLVSNATDWVPQTISNFTVNTLGLSDVATGGDSTDLNDSDDLVRTSEDTNVGSTKITDIVQIGQADYDSLVSKDAGTLYIINGA